jgi:hypothetical protein
MSGTATFEMQQSYGGDAGYPDVWIANGTITNKTASTELSFTQPIHALRLRLTASSSGVVTLRVIQAGV